MPDTTTAPESSTTSTTRFILSATIVGDEVRLTGDGLRGDTIMVARGTDAIVEIQDAAGYYVYASEIPPGGAATRSWQRNTTLTASLQTFYAVDRELASFVFAAEAANTSKKPKYGPVIKVKPVG